MSNFRKNQNKVSSAKTGIMLSSLIVVLILNISLQIWLMYAALNNALHNDTEILIPAFVASAVIFFIGFGWLYYLPEGKDNIRK